MKAALFHSPGDVRFEEVPNPTLSDGEVLLRIRACGICGSDLHTYRHGMFLGALGLPTGAGHILGHEFSGEVAEIKGDVPGLRVGDRIATTGIGGNAEFYKVPAQMASLLRKIPDSISFEEAATTEPLATSLHGVNLADPADEQTLVIMGAGIIGLGVLQAIRARCAAKVFVVDLSYRRLETAKGLGANEIINAARDDAVARILEMNAPEAGASAIERARQGAVDTVFDCAGVTRDFEGTTVLEQSLTLVRQSGKVVVVAAFERPVTLDYNIIMSKGIQVLGSWAWVPDEFDESLRLITSGTVDRSPLISHRFPLEQASEAYETQLRAEEAIKVVFTP